MDADVNMDVGVVDCVYVYADVAVDAVMFMLLCMWMWLCM